MPSPRLFLLCSALVSVSRRHEALRVAVCVGLAASVCGCAIGNMRPTRNSVQEAGRSPSGYLYRDGDLDDENGKDKPYAFDDYPVADYGKQADARDYQAITDLISHYYRAAARQDGRDVCSLLYSRLERDPGLAHAGFEPIRIEVAHPHVAGRASCARTVSVFLSGMSRNVRMEDLAFRVTGVRTSGNHGVALIVYKSRPEAWMPLIREYGSWKLEVLLAHTIE